MSFKHVKHAECLVVNIFEGRICFFVVVKNFDFVYISDIDWYTVPFIGIKMYERRLPKLDFGFGGCRLAVCLVLCDCISLFSIR